MLAGITEKSRFISSISGAHVYTSGCNGQLSLMNGFNGDDVYFVVSLCHDLGISVYQGGSLYSVLLYNQLVCLT